MFLSVKSCVNNWEKTKLRNQQSKVNTRADMKIANYSVQYECMNKIRISIIKRIMCNPMSMILLLRIITTGKQRFKDFTCTGILRN